MLGSSPQPTSAARRAGVQTAEILFEVCERRLVLSAQLLFDVLGDQALELHAGGASHDPLVPIVPHADSVPLESHLQQAHAASGWNQVQQQFGLTGKGQTVAVIDSGIAWDHVALGQGYGPGYRVVGGWDFTEENDANPYDDGPVGFHGTHVSGIIGSDDPTHSGVAPDVDFVALRVFNDVGQGQLSWVEKALEWVHTNRNSFENPITTVNLSLGTSWNADTIPAWATLENELQALYNDGIVVTASAGNSFQQYNAPGLSYPAASSYVMPISSVDDDGDLSDFSQRNSRVIAAPGSNILSTVPDHVLGRDGQVNDFATASGTSMAAPYVAGASVLVRQAMEMVGLQDINLRSIADHLHSTADSVFDSLTGASYDRLNLQRAIETLIPIDTIGNDAGSAAELSLATTHVDGWINTTTDVDVYRFTPTTSGTLQLDANSPWIDSLAWTLRAGNSTLAQGGDSPESLHLAAGQSYELFVSSHHSIGAFELALNFTATPGAPGGEAPAAGTPATDLGSVRYLEETLPAGSVYRAQAVADGTFSVQWTNADAAQGTLSIVTTAGASYSDSSWSAGQLRVDLEVRAGEWVEFALPGSSSDSGDLALANVLHKSGTALHVMGTADGDAISLDLRDGTQLDFGAVHYGFAAGQVSSLTLDSYGGSDVLNVVGSELADKVDLRPTGSTIENTSISISIASTETILYDGAGGPDRVYLYDSNQDDTLTAHPRRAELAGVGYRFQVDNVSRIFVHATGGGQDYAYLYDSSGDDRLSVRPQFTSLSGDGFFNYVRGFERVYAYANAGGIDEASLYDSSGNDRFMTNGAAASIVGPGFSSYTRSFEQVYAISAAGGNDVAALYGTNAQTDWQQGSDFVSFRESGWNREARGFQQVETFIAGQPHRLSTATADVAMGSAVVGTFATATTEVVAMPVAWPFAPHQAGQLAANVDGAEAGYDRGAIGNYPGMLDGAIGDTAGYDRGTIRDNPKGDLLETTRSLRDWVSHEVHGDSDGLDKLHLPEESLLSDPELENQLLDKIFRDHEDLF